MRFQKLVLIVSSIAAINWVIPVSAQQDLQKRFEEIKRPNIGPIDIPQDKLRGPSLDSGATHWVSPMLDNSPGTINGEPFTIDRKSLKQTFELSTINPNNSRPANAFIDCYSKEGIRLSRYSSAFVVPPSGASNWSASSVTPPASGDGGVTDVDTIWCVVGADLPIAAFGWSVRRFGSEVSKYHFSLERVSASSN